jgi:hypothetical protein
MAIYALKWSDQGGNGSVAYPDCAGDVVSNRYEADLAVTPLKGVTLAANDIIDVGIIPANATVVDVILDSDDLDTGGAPALAFDVGIMSGTPGDTVTARTCGAEFFSASTLAQAGGVARSTLKTTFRVAPVGYDRSVGIKITTAAATLATTGKLGVSVHVTG